MSEYDFTAQRLFLDLPLKAGEECAAPASVHNYLLNVLRFRVGDAIHVFNGRDGEFRARLSEASRRQVRLRIEERLRAQTAPADIVSECLRLTRGKAHEGGLRLSCELAPGLPNLMVDRLRFKQVLLNLCSNAIKFTKAGSIRVHISRPHGDSLLRLEVRDSGIGLPDDIASRAMMRVFARFSEQYREVRLDVTTGLSRDLTRRYRAGEFDIIAVKEPTPSADCRASFPEPIGWHESADRQGDWPDPLPLVGKIARSTMTRGA